MICKNKIINRFISILQFWMSLQIFRMVAQAIASTSSPQRETPHKSIKSLQVQPIAQVAFDCILFGESLSSNNYTWWNEHNFLPKLHKSRQICVSFQNATTNAPSLKYRFVLTLMSKYFHKYKEFSLTHVNFFFNVLKLQ